MILVASIALLTALMAATMSLVITDLKRILAYSTITDLAFMMLALGAGGLTAGMFHLLTHGFSKALLFLAAGSVAHGSGKTDIGDMGGLARRMPVTAVLFAIGALSLGGMPPLSGFFSKDEVLASVLVGHIPLFFIGALVVSALKALYMGRALFAVFFGPLKHENEHAHESPRVMLLPMMVLGFLALTSGFLALSYTQGYQGFGTFLYAEHPEAFHFNWWLAGLSLVIAVAGFYVTWVIYARRTFSTQGIIAGLARVHRLLVNKYYMDHIYQWCIDRAVLVFCGFVALFDRVVVNDGGVNGTGESVVRSGWRLRYLESGKVYNYALGMVLGLVALALILWFAIPG
jgi:NADH-quinone oxidoreductase subunit L